jgi:hypothetical protein
MSGIIAGLIGSLKTVVASIVNKYFTLYYVGGTGNQFYSLERARDLEIDQNDNLYFTGDSYLYKYAKDGSFVWAKSFNGDSAKGANLCIDSQSIYISSANASNMATLTKMDFDGNVIWNKQTTSYPINQSLPGKIINFNSTQLIVEMGHYAAHGKDSDYGYLTLINKSDGSMVSYLSIGGFPNCIAVDNSGNLWIGQNGPTFQYNSSLIGTNSWLSYSAYFNAIKFDSSGNMYGWMNYSGLAKFNSSRSNIWSYSYNVSSNSILMTSNNKIFDIDSSGYIYFIPGQERQQYGSTYKAPVYKIDSSNGNIVWSKLTSLYQYYGTWAAIKTLGNTYVSSISTNQIIHKFKPDGTYSQGNSYVTYTDYANSSKTSLGSLNPFTGNNIYTTPSWTSGSIFDWSTYSYTTTNGTAVSNENIYT